MTRGREKEGLSRPGIFSRTFRFDYVASPPGPPLHFHDRHRDLRCRCIEVQQVYAQWPVRCHLITGKLSLFLFPFLSDIRCRLLLFVKFTICRALQTSCPVVVNEQLAIHTLVHKYSMGLGGHTEIARKLKRTREPTNTILKSTIPFGTQLTLCVRPQCKFDNVGPDAQLDSSLVPQSADVHTRVTIQNNPLGR